MLSCPATDVIVVVQGSGTIPITFATSITGAISMKGTGSVSPAPGAVIVVRFASSVAG
jgi:hypothetical protein